MSTYIDSIQSIVANQTPTFPQFNPPLTIQEIVNASNSKIISEAVPKVVSKSVPKVMERVVDSMGDMSQDTVKVLTSQEFGSSLENAGYDLRAFEEKVIPPGTTHIIKTDLRMQMPHKMFFKVESRSGLAVKGIFAQGGVIDCSYRNYIGVILYNSSKETFAVRIGDRIAQGIFLPVYHPKIESIKDTTEFDVSERGEKGFGSSGLQ